MGRRVISAILTRREYTKFTLRIYIRPRCGHTFNPSTKGAEAGRPLSSKSARSYT